MTADTIVAQDKAVTDAYPSRRELQPSILPRKDPVIHGTAGHDGLGTFVLAQYERDGFFAFDRFLDEPAVATLREEMERLRYQADPSDPAVICEPKGEVIRSIFAVHERSAVFDRIVRDGRILALVEQILGGPVYVHQTRINYKSGFEGEQFYWHSDFETWHTEDGMPRMRAASISIALCENMPINGPLMLIPGSHKHYVTCVGETPEDHFKQSLRQQEIGVPDAASLTWLADQAGRIAAPVGPAGSMVLFDCNTMHGSNGNLTPYPRSNLFVVYNSIENALEAPFAGTRPRPSFIAARKAVPLTAA